MGYYRYRGSKKEDAVLGSLLILFLIIILFVFIENKIHTYEERFYVVDKYWDIKTSQYWTETWTTYDYECSKNINTGKEECSWKTNYHSRNNHIKDCRSGGLYNDPVYYPDCPLDRRDAWNRTTEYFNIIFGKNEERKTLYVNLDWYNWLKREEICNLYVYRGAFGEHIKSIKDCN